MRSSKLIGLLLVGMFAVVVPSLFTGPARATPAVASPVTMPGGVVPVSPLRVLDTRDGTGAAKAAVGTGQSVTFTVTGKGFDP